MVLYLCTSVYSRQLVLWHKIQRRLQTVTVDVSNLQLRAARLLQEDLVKDLKSKTYMPVNSLTRLDVFGTAAVILSTGSGGDIDAELELGIITEPVDLETTASSASLA